MPNSSEAHARQELLNEIQDIEARLARWQNLQWTANETTTRLQERRERIYEQLEKFNTAQQLSPLSRKSPRIIRMIQKYGSNHHNCGGRGVVE
jgi:uncharacterized coiled-coil DUF342 family protein